MRSISTIITTFLAIVATGVRLDAGVIYDAAADFSPTSNPSGVWSYGYSNSLNSAFQLYTQSGPNNENSPPADQLDTWNAGTGGQHLYPSVLHNGAANDISSDGFTYLPGQLGLHPGAAGQYSIVRFTAPSAGTYSLTSAFYALGAGYVDVHVLHNGSSIYSGVVEGPPAGFNSLLTLSAGEILDFKVGYGSDQSYNGDSTGADLVIEKLSAVPEPGTLTLFGFGALGLAIGRRKLWKP